MAVLTAAGGETPQSARLPSPLWQNSEQIVAMQCPRCNQIRYCRDWAKSQWSNFRPVTNELQGCKLCRNSPQAPAAPGSIALRDAAMDTLRHCIPRDRQSVTNFVYTWLQLPEGYRRGLSHSGAVKCRHPPRNTSWLLAASGTVYGHSQSQLG